jgi:peptidoglycan/xylan/chitin deacetylase (PgdA/CDA1 family)
MKTVRFWAAETRRRLISHISPRPIALGNHTPIVSFCFDDFPRSALTIGGAILHAHGARGTYYAAVGLMSTHNELGEQFHREDLDTLLREGHELGCHTFQHLSCRSVTPSEFEIDVDKGRKVIHHMTGYDPTNFAYPYGHVTALVKKRIGARMRSCRSIYGGVNGPVADFNLLSANSLYGDTDQFGSAATLLANGREEGRWLIFYTHDVRDRPSPYGCTPALFEQTVTRALKEGFTIVPVAAVTEAAEHGTGSQSMFIGDAAAVPPGGQT